MPPLALVLTVKIISQIFKKATIGGAFRDGLRGVENVGTKVGTNIQIKCLTPPLFSLTLKRVMYYVYVIENELSELYVGSTNDLKRRLLEHQQGKSIATKGHDWLLVYYEAYRSEADARQREQAIKRYGGTRKHLRSRIERSRRSD